MTCRGRPRRFDREVALQQAMELFWQQGFEGTSLADLTKAMGIKAPSLYAAFGSKEALFKEAVDLYVRTQGGGIWDQVAEAPTARKAVEGVLRRSAEAFTRGATPRGCLVVLAAPQAQGSNTEVCDELKKRRAQNVTFVEHRLRQAMEEGELPPGIDCGAVARYFVTVQHGMSIQARDGASRDELLKVADCAMAAWEGLVHRAS